MDRQKLEHFIKSISGFDDLTKSSMIIHFGFYLQTEENYPQFTASDIDECFDAFDYEKSANTVDLLYKLCNRNKSKPLISKENGYRVKKQISDQIRTQNTLSDDSRLEKVFKPGEMYEFYKQIKSLANSAQSGIFIIDAYANEDVIELYLDNLPLGIQMNILTNTPKGNFLKVAQKFKQKHGGNFKVKSHKSCHDRLFFSDKKCYVIGQSIDRAADDKPTYICEIMDSGKFRLVFQDMFNSAKTLV